MARPSAVAMMSPTRKSARAAGESGMTAERTIAPCVNSATKPCGSGRTTSQYTRRAKYATNVTAAAINRLIEAAKTIETSPFLAEKIILSVHTGLRRSSLFHRRWDYVDFLNRVVRIPRTKSGRPHALPLNATVLTTLQALYTKRLPDCPYVFAHAMGRQAGEPVKDVKNAFHTALEIAEIKDFTWHDLRHHADSRIMPTALGHERERGGDRALPEASVGMIRGARETRGVDRVDGTGLVSRRSAWCVPAPAL
jgi:integrase